MQNYYGVPHNKKEAYVTITVLLFYLLFLGILQTKWGDIMIDSANRNLAQRRIELGLGE